MFSWLSPFRTVEHKIFYEIETIHLKPDILGDGLSCNPEINVRR